MQADFLSRKKQDPKSERWVVRATFRRLETWKWISLLPEETWSSFYAAEEQAGTRSHCQMDFLIDWSEGLIYFFPLSHSFLEYYRKSRDSRSYSSVPSVAESQSWYSELLLLSLQPPFPCPLSLDLLSLRNSWILHCYPGTLHVSAWMIWGSARYLWKEILCVSSNKNLFLL